ncbi:unnamed protein product [Dibothriocephalus latus]|uniref:Uncharacterized protein n=1 Tax=Dibothriocephalus latus TaxID=60516 RepID=A0A3P7NZ92_DIBLA|nr:unnamed protein product [Dibothriocephalus latus]
MKQDPESCVLPRSTGLPFIGTLKPEDLPPVVKPAFKSSPVKNKLGWSDGLETAVTNEPPSSTDSRLAHNLAIQNKRLMCMQDDFSDWCSSLTCQLLLLPIIAQTMERHCSTHVTYVNDNCGCSVWNVVGREFNKLVCTGPSALSNLLCVRDAVVATPPLLKTCLPSVQSPDSLSKPPLVAVAEKVAPCLQCLLPFLPSSRWLSRSASSHPRFALSFTASSGKLVALQNLLKDLILGELPPISNHDTHNVARVPWRPRCIFLVAHRTTCLDLLQAWLACHPLFSALTHLRLPSDHLDTTAELNSCLERVNNWPLGSHGPLLVLVHARAPSLSLSGLRAGPDTRVVVLDADWRIEVVDGLRTKFVPLYDLILTSLISLLTFLV